MSVLAKTLLLNIRHKLQLPVECLFVSTFGKKQGFQARILSDSDTGDIVFLIHASKKTTSKEFKKHLMKFVTNMVQRANSESQFAAVTYGSTPETIFEFSKFQNKKAIRKTFKKVKAKKRSKTADIVAALKHVRTKVFVPESGDLDSNPNHIVIITDQTSKKLNESALQDELYQLRMNRTRVFHISIDKSQPYIEKEREIQLIGHLVGENATYVVRNYSALLSSKELPRKLGRAMRPFCEFNILK